MAADEPDDQAKRHRITVEEAERIYTPAGEHPKRIKRFPQLALPFGFNNDEWESLKAQMRPGDELWQFSTAPRTWKAKMGRAGIELIRDGKRITFIITSMN